jgi:hypothetical protein
MNCGHVLREREGYFGIANRAKLEIRAWCLFVHFEQSIGAIPHGGKQFGGRPRICAI